MNTDGKKSWTCSSGSIATTHTIARHVASATGARIAMRRLNVDWGEDDGAKKWVAFALAILAIEALVMGMFVSWWIVPLTVVLIVSIVVGSISRVS